MHKGNSLMRHNKMDLSKLLGTKNRKRQAERVEQLVNAPVIDIIIRYDARKENPLQNILALGGDPPLESVLGILDMARDMVLQRMITAANDPQVMQFDEPQQHPDPQGEDNAEPSPEMNAQEGAAK